MSNNPDVGTIFDVLFIEPTLIIVFSVLFITSLIFMFRMFKERELTRTILKFVHVMSLLLFLLQLFVIRMFG